MPSDAELVSEAQRGDAAAFGALVRRHQDRLYNLCYRMSQNHADALDLTQASFLRAWEALPRFEVRAGFYTWLYRIAVNLMLTERRKAKRRGDVSLEHVMDGQDVPDGNHEADPALQAEQAELVERIEGALGQLEDDYRVAVVLKDVERLDYRTIAEILGLPLGTVKSRIHRARQLLVEIMKSEAGSQQRGIA